jgi:hypothetical protein
MSKRVFREDPRRARHQAIVVGKKTPNPLKLDAPVVSSPKISTKTAENTPKIENAKISEK